MNIVEVVFGGCGEEVTKLKVVETNSMFKICIAKFIKVMDSGGIMCLKD
jgi:hypothetical protein